MSSLGIVVDDPLKSVYQEVFERCKRDYFSGGTNHDMDDIEDLDTSLSAD